MTQLSKSINYLKAVLLFLLIPFTPDCGQTAADRANLFSPQNRLSFAAHLYSNQDYLRAANEFREFLKFESNDTVQFRFANCFYKIGRFDEAADNFKTLFFGTQLSHQAKLMFYESNFFSGNYKPFRELVDAENYLPQKFIDEVGRLKSISYLMDDAILPDVNVLLKPFPDSNQTQLAKFYWQKKYPKYKSATTAGFLSAIIPGAGKIYTGEIGDGITAFITTVLSAYLAYSNFKADHQFRGWLFTGLTAFFYGGNIYGSAVSAKIFNARIRINLDNNIKLYFEQRNYFLPEINF